MKIVLVSQRVDYIKDRTETRDSIDQNLINFLNQAGFKVVTVPNVNANQEDFLKLLVNKLSPHGIVLSGGNNVGDYVKRDKLEYELINISLNKKIPLIGICRGMQLINTYFGGTLKIIKDHVNKKHFVSNLNNHFEVNSFHDFTIDNQPKELKTFLTAEDGTIESFKHINNFIMGIMWHPEREISFKKFDLDLFKSFFNG